MEYPLSTNDPRQFPGAVPTTGFLPPDDAFPVERADGPEVLVNLPGEGLTGWTRKVAGVLRRGWQQQLAIFTITHALPSFVLYTLAVAGLLALWNSDVALAAVTDDALAEKLGMLVVIAVCLMLVAALPFRLLGYAAATWSAVAASAALELPVAMLLFPTVLVTYVERRAVAAPNLRTPHLLDELG